MGIDWGYYNLSALNCHPRPQTLHTPLSPKQSQKVRFGLAEAEARFRFPRQQTSLGAVGTSV